VVRNPEREIAGKRKKTRIYRVVRDQTLVLVL
jgi:hypothetical protein